MPIHCSKLLVFGFASVLVLSSILAGAAQAARRPSHVGTITAIANTTMTIHAKTRKTYYHFVINAQTEFLQHGRPVARNLFKVGTYVTVSYATGPHNTLIAVHISLRQTRK